MPILQALPSRGGESATSLTILRYKQNSRPRNTSASVVVAQSHVRPFPRLLSFFWCLSALLHLQPSSPGGPLSHPPSPDRRQSADAIAGASLQWALDTARCDRQEQPHHPHRQPWVSLHGQQSRCWCCWRPLLSLRMPACRWRRSSSPAHRQADADTRFDSHAITIHNSHVDRGLLLAESLRPTAVAAGLNVLLEPASRCPQHPHYLPSRWQV